MFFSWQTKVFPIIRPDFLSIRAKTRIQWWQARCSFHNVMTWYYHVIVSRDRSGKWKSIHVTECVLNLKTQLLVVIENGPREVGMHFDGFSANHRIHVCCKSVWVVDLVSWRKSIENAYRLPGNRSRWLRGVVSSDSTRILTHVQTFIFRTYIVILSRDSIAP